jgi:hypothetical protein
LSRTKFDCRLAEFGETIEPIVASQRHTSKDLNRSFQS